MDSQTNPQQSQQPQQVQQHQEAEQHQQGHESQIQSQHQPQQANETVPENQITDQRKTVQFKADVQWDIENFQEQEAIKQFSKLASYNIGSEQVKQHVHVLKFQEKLKIVQANIKTVALTKVFVFTLRGENPDYSKIEIVRKYSDFYAFRETLAKRWPGCYVPPVPEKGNVGATDKQIMKNKLFVLNNFLDKIIQTEYFSGSEELKVFIFSPENQVESNLSKLKQHSIEDLYGLYKSSFPHIFQKSDEQDTRALQQKIKLFHNYFGEKKKELAKQKDDMKRLAELRTKLTTLRYQVLQKSLPEYESVCLDWFDGKTASNKQSKKQVKQEASETQKQVQQQENDQRKIYSSTRYQSALEAYKFDLFPQEKGENEDWLIYELFKFELSQIEAILQIITNYKYFDTQRKYYQRNIEANKAQLEDIDKKKLSLKILLLAGSEEDKKTHLTNQNQLLETNLKLANELWGASTNLMGEQIQKFQVDRCDFYKKSLMKVFKKEAVYMGKLFNLYVEIHKLRKN